MTQTTTPTTYTVDYTDTEGRRQTVAVTSAEILAVVLRALVDAGVTDATVTTG